MSIEIPQQPSCCHLPSFMAEATTFTALLAMLQLMLRKGLKHVGLDKEKKKKVKMRQNKLEKTHSFYSC